jgi:hypothetical protein
MIRVMKSRRMIWARHGTDEKCETVLVGKPERRRPVGVVGRIILKWILEEQGGKLWTLFIWLRIGTGGGIL